MTNRVKKLAKNYLKLNSKYWKLDINLNIHNQNIGKAY